MPKRYGWNVFKNQFDLYDRANFQGSQSDTPTSPEQGDMYIDTDDNILYIYYGSTWQAIHELTPAADSFLLLETGDALLLESGGKLVLEV